MVNGQSKVPEPPRLLAPHPGYWLSQKRLNVTQKVVSAFDLFLMPETSELDPKPPEPFVVMVHMHFHDDDYHHFAASVCWETGEFWGYSMNLLTGWDRGRWGLVSHERFLGLTREEDFRPKPLLEALRVVNRR